MRIATWNVGYGVNQEANKRCRQRMRRVDADVWVVTETHDSLTLEDDGYHSVQGAERPMREGNASIRSGSRWVTIWSRLPIEPIDLTRVDPRRAAATVKGKGNAVLAVYGTVLPWTGDTVTGGMRAELTQQVGEWETLRGGFEGRFCLAGDFNVNLGGKHYYGSNDSKQAVKDALEKAGLVAMTRYDNTPERRYGIIDHIAIPVDVEPASELFCIWGDRDSQGRELSDHSGAAVDIDTW